MCRNGFVPLRTAYAEMQKMNLLTSYQTAETVLFVV